MVWKKVIRDTVFYKKYGSLHGEHSTSERSMQTVRPSKVSPQSARGRMVYGIQKPITALNRMIYGSKK